MSGQNDYASELSTETREQIRATLEYCDALPVTIYRDGTLDLLGEARRGIAILIASDRRENASNTTVDCRDPWLQQVLYEVVAPRLQDQQH